MTIDPWLLERIPTAVGVLKDLVLAGAAVCTATFAGRALSKWREETIGKRRLELAEEILAAFYQAQEVIQDARAPLVWASEMAPEEGVSDEITGSAYYAPIRRLRLSFDKIADLRTKRHQFAAVFGLAAAEPWSEIEHVLNTMHAASDALLSLRGEHILASDSLSVFYAEQRRILARGGEDDPITPRIAAAVTAIEAICRPIIRDAVRR